MPSRNVIKEYALDSYYHIYNRGVNKQAIFLDEQDYKIYLSFLKRHLSLKPEIDMYGRLHPHYRDIIRLLAYCLMPNHFHLLVYQMEDEKALSKLMQSVCTAYTMYFNRKYKRVGRLFQGTFRAKRITSDEYLQHISRYIHLNPEDYKKYNWSSLAYYIGSSSAEWLDTDRIIDLFEQGSYLSFLEDYEDFKQSLDELKDELAN